MDSKGALQQLQTYQRSIQSPDKLLESSQAQLGIPQAQQNLSGLRGAIAQTTGLLNRVAPSVMGRTQNSLVTSAQADRQIGNESAPIAKNLNQYNQDYGLASADYNELNRQAEARSTAALQGQQGQMSYLQSLYQDLSSSEQAQRDEVFRQAQLAETKRQADLTAATARANAGGGAGLSVDAIGKYLDQFIGSAGKAGGPSQAQVNAAATLKSLGGPVAANYNGNPSSALAKVGLNSDKAAMPGWLRSWLHL